MSEKLPKGAMKGAANAAAWAIGRMSHRGFMVRRVVWGRLMARSEKRPDEQIRRAMIYVARVEADNV